MKGLTYDRVCGAHPATVDKRLKWLRSQTPPLPQAKRGDTFSFSYRRNQQVKRPTASALPTPPQDALDVKRAGLST